VALSPAPIQLDPNDPHNERLLANVDPGRYPQPTSTSRYNLVVIGAGTAGLVAVAGAAGLGAKVALIERHLMGGDCLNYGCVPSKALLAAARAAAARCDASRMGISAAPPADVAVDFAAVMERMRRLRADLSGNDSAARFTAFGVDVFHGEGRFTGMDTVAVGEQTLRFSRAVIATGGRAVALPIPGLAEAGYLTNETVFALIAMPPRIAVIGAGPVGCELAQALRRFGAGVTVLEVAPRILIHEEPDAAARVAQALASEGVGLLTGATIVRIERRDRAKVVHFERAGASHELTVEELILGVGRAANVASLGLEVAGVAYDPNGVRVDDYLRTTNKRIYAAGDVCTPMRFTHMADAMARVVLRNALFRGRARVSALTIPSCVYTDPEIAHVGIDPAQAAERGLRLRTFVQELAEVDRAVLDGATAGLVKVHVAEGSDRILGATIVARHASEMISELTIAIAHRIGLGALADVIHPYPTQAEAIRKLGDAYNRTRLTPFVKRLFTKWLAWNR
jgi:pyruvate/2-oxoglutarate dehydrogenase complex dihydrolipoamide dehydrogenase (E3) component